MRILPASRVPFDTLIAGVPPDRPNDEVGARGSRRS
jgi:hypothetical protein